jgi:predicted nicotinamide N-methyase
VVLNDIDPTALHIARLNAAHNSLTMVTTEQRLDSVATLSGYDVILVADFFYERSEAAQMEQLLRQVARQGCVVLVADGQRPFAPSRAVELLEQREIAVARDVEGVGSRQVRLMRLTEECGVSQ